MSAFGVPLEIWSAVVIGAAVLGAGVRLVLRRRAAPDGARGPAWRLAALIALQPTIGMLLHLTLFPPDLPLRAGALVIATAGAPDEIALAPGETLVALPEGRHVQHASPAPDLATALRRNPAAARVRIVGDGLTPRDQGPPAVPVVFDPPTTPRGVTDLTPPPPVAAGETFSVGGQISGVGAGSIELADPAGVAVDRDRIASGGRFTLTARARTSGLALFELRLRDARGALLERIGVPVETRTEPQPRVRVLAGAPSADTKFLSRWADEAGVAIDQRLDLGAGAQIGEAGSAMTAAGLADIDFLVLDDRRWERLDGGERAALAAAVENGLGLLLRPTGPLSAATRRDWAALGAPLSGDGDDRPLRLEPSGGRGTPASPRDEPPPLARRDLVLEGDRSVSIIRGADGVPAAGWRARGRGRIGVWTVADSYVLVLAGDDRTYGRLWSDLFSALARPRDAARPHVDGPARVGQRLTICGVAAGAASTDPSGRRAALVIDPRGGGQACAAYWPLRPGWHGVREPGGRETAFHVRPAGEAPSLAAFANRRATLALAASQTAGVAQAGSPGAGSPWPWFAGLLFGLAVLWILERRRQPASAVARNR